MTDERQDALDEADVLNTKALRLHGNGDATRAIALVERALALRESVLGPDHPEVATLLANLATLCAEVGAQERAESLCNRALQIRERAFGSEHPFVGLSLVNAASIYELRGAYDQAEVLYRRALVLYEKTLAPDHLALAMPLSNLAALYRDQGAYADARPLFERALQIHEKAFGTEHPDVATSVNNLGAICHDQGEHARAKVLYERALGIRERLLGPEHLSVATSLNNLGLLHKQLEDYAQAAPLYERALHIREHRLGLHHPVVANSLDNLARLYQAQGAYAQAERQFERALRIYEQVQGAEHPAVATTLNDLAVLCWLSGDAPRALSYLVRAATLRERYVAATVASLPERRKRQFLQLRRCEDEILVSFHAHCAPDDIRALDLTLTATLRRKGRILAELISEQAALRREASLPGSSASSRLDAQVTPERVQAALPSDAVLLEFVAYRRFDPRVSEQNWREPRYLVYILRREGPAQWLALGEAALIEAAITAALAALAQPGRDARDHLRMLDELVFAPIRRLVGHVDHVLISPDGALHLVPFAALIDEDGRHMAETLLITYLTSSRDLLRAETAHEVHAKPLVLAAPDYQGRWPDLPRTRSEAAALEHHFADIELYTGQDATKDKLAAGRGRPFVHIAAHGFSRTSLKSPSEARARSRYTQRDVSTAPSWQLRVDDRVDIEDALDDAGLVLASTNDVDAVLTAREIAAIDLRGTQLVVLSACDTAVGDVARSEGVYGLCRALAIAGVESQVVSLWRVDDEATSWLMDRYYAALRAADGRSHALRQAQLDLLHGGRYAHPAYWAGFVAIGDHRPLWRSAQPV